MSELGWREVAFGLKCTLAALVAIFIAAGENMTSPGWAGLTVFLVSQPLAGAAGAAATRALHRMAGTIAGVAASLVIIPAFASSPELLVGAMAAWIALCVFVSLLDRSPRGYAFILSGYTVALVGLPLAGTDPGSLFDLAVARAEEILLGGACAAIVHGLVAPRSLVPLLLGKVERLLEEARAWILRGLAPEPAEPAERAARQKVAAELSELRTLAASVRIEPGVTSRQVAALRALERQLAALLPLVTGIEERVLASRSEPSLAAPAGRLLALARDAIEGRRHEDDAALEGMASDPDAPPEDAALAGLRHRLGELVKAWQDARALASVLRDPLAVNDERIAGLMAEAERRPLHVDVGLAAWSALAAGVAVIAASTLCWVLGWSQGAFAVGIASASSSIFASFDDPRPLHRIMLVATAIAIPVAALYVFGLLPALDGFMLLALVLAPLFFVTGLFLGTPSYSLYALGFALITQSLISVQPAYGADFVSFTGVAVGTLLGSVVALVVASLIRVVSAEHSVWRLVRAGWRELASLADGDATEARHRWTSRMLDRAGLLLPRMGRVEGLARAKAATVLEDLRSGVAVIELRGALDGVAIPTRNIVLDVLGQVARHFRGLVRHDAHASGPRLLASLDAAIAALMNEPPGPARLQALTAATGLRAALYPAAAGPAVSKESTS
jgi:uncharacterized membrane protein YccC